MSIPFSQLETWANQGATVTAKSTHESIRNALSYRDSPVAGKISNGSVKVYLQGSYKNDTNIRGDSDVDLVVELTNTFGHNANELTADEQRLHSEHYSDAIYQWAQFRGDVIKALKTYYGSQLVDETGNKSIKLLPANGRLKADVVPVIQYRKYNYFYGPESHSCECGVKFYHKTTGAGIINYPEHHYQNGIKKHQNTGNQFKHVVRILKNARSYAIDKGLLGADKAPSYFLQCLIYNVPDNYFGDNYSDSTLNVLKYLYTTPLDKYRCQNEQTLLFGSGSDQWNIADAQEAIIALVHVWDKWYEL